MRHRQTRVIIQGVGSEEELRALHLYIVVEHRHLGLGVVLTPVGGECGLAVDHLSALEEVGVIIQTVEVETIGIESCLLVFQYHVVTGTGHLLVTIVISVVAE